MFVFSVHNLAFLANGRRSLSMYIRFESSGEIKTKMMGSRKTRELLISRLKARKIDVCAGNRGIMFTLLLTLRPLYK